jgi:hypothetical protein
MRKSPKYPFGPPTRARSSKSAAARDRLIAPRPPFGEPPATDDFIAARRAVLSTDSAARKRIPVVTGVMDYFPDAIAAVANVSFVGNEKHNPGQPLHWSRGKSPDHADCIGRHLLERGTMDPVTNVRHSAQLAWRALALLQIEIEADRAGGASQAADENKN